MSRTAPLLPPEVNVSSLPYMPLYIARLTGSKAWLVCKRKPELTRPLLCLWMRAWQERPAGSIENDDDVMAHACELEFDKFQDLRDDLLRGWKLCSDGRYYNQALCEFALIAWETVLKNKKRTAAATRARMLRDGERDVDVTSQNTPRNDHQGGKEGRKDKEKRGATGAANSHDAYLDTLTWARNPDKPVTDPVALRVIDALGGIDQLRAKSDAALRDLLPDFKARYSAEQRTGAH